MPLGAALCSTVFQGFAVAQSPTAHGIQPRPGEVFCGGRSAPLVIVACKLSSRTFPVTDPFLHGAGKEKQLVVTTSVGMQLRQKQPPHMPILEKRGSVNISCSIHEKNLLPTFRPFYVRLKYPVKRIIERAQPLEGRTRPHLHMWPLGPHRVATQSAPPQAHIRSHLQGAIGARTLRSSGSTLGKRALWQYAGTLEPKGRQHMDIEKRINEGTGS